ncbi:Ras family protein (macronuclear) [Tetrahymena thermophila SB210]|uniref:Ras family protein n=1 Tax=Tetrahymena thermophila (strain SB210) TaxID=312017 RepID=A4VE00_TETTS|nr:Ras family protein [Tetrahymena thermophila SB210]EDK31760.2 Ras family protein [Tetrahymena thermophila SB210]|eukprot:XP_001470778.2 Ras family protein [Tetrahymena thermophila SB210]
MQDIQQQGEKGLQTIIVANKIGLVDKRVISIQQGEELAFKYRVPFFEVQTIPYKNRYSLVGKYKLIAISLEPLDVQLNKLYYQIRKIVLNKQIFQIIKKVKTKIHHAIAESQQLTNKKTNNFF